MTTLYVKAFVQIGFDVANSLTLWSVNFTAPEGQYFPTPYVYNVAQGTLDPAATPYPLFPTPASAIAYYSATAAASLLSDLNTLYGATVYSVTQLDTVDSGVHDKLAALATVATTGSYNDLSSKPSVGGTRTQSTLSLSMVGTGATGTQIDATHDALIAVTISTNATASIAGAATSTVALKICATNNATEASWTTVQTSETSQSYSLAVAIQGVTGGKGCLSSLVPAGWYAKLVNTGSGTHSESFVSGQKVIFS